MSKHVHRNHIGGAFTIAVTSTENPVQVASGNKAAKEAELAEKAKSGETKAKRKSIKTKKQNEK